MSKGILLETTIQIKRITLSADVREKIDSELYGKIVRTTAFVFREFVNTMIMALRDGYKDTCLIPVDARGKIPLGELSRQLSKRGYSPRTIQRCVIVMACIQDKFSLNTVSHKRLMAFLERTSLNWRRDFFEINYNGKKQKIDLIHPVLLDTEDELDELRNGVPFPAKAKFPACAASFLEDRKNHVKVAVDAIQKSEPKIRRKAAPILEVLDRLKSDAGDYDFLNRLKPNTKGNWWLGDLLIALKQPPYLSIYTTDQLFDVLCDALGKKVYDGYKPK